jgi:hypothetical protein
VLKERGFILKECKNIVASRPAARQTSNYTTAIAKQWPINSNRGMAFSAQSVLMAAHTAVEYIKPLLSNNCTATDGVFYAVCTEMS